MVSTSLFTGLSGLRLHQNYIDVIGNNLANVSTAGFRGARPTFFHFFFARVCAAARAAKCAEGVRGVCCGR